MAEQKENLYVKILHKPYQDYCLTKKEQLKAENCVWIYYIKPPKNDNDFYSYYAEMSNCLNAKSRTILFYDVPIRLSKQQFCMLNLLLVGENIFSSNYAFLSNACNGKEMKKSSIDDNLKCFISDFINEKMVKAIAEYKEKQECYFSNMSKAQVKQFAENLVYYKSLANGFVIKTSYYIKQKERVKKGQL